MNRFWTADLHLGHANIIRHCQRPFADVDEMSRALIANWNETVSAHDVVYILGDLVWRKQDLALISQLVGIKILLPGNHDRCWPQGSARARREEQAYLEAGIAEIWHPAVRFNFDPRWVEGSHFPYHDVSRHGDEYAAYRPVDRGDWLLHGHVHTAWQREGRQINVGVDVWDYRPVSEQELRAIMGISTPTTLSTSAPTPTPSPTI